MCNACTMPIEGLKPRSKDLQFGAGYDLECPHCGRLYDSEDSPALKAGAPCPEDECPTYWELSGKTFLKENN